MKRILVLAALTAFAALVVASSAAAGTGDRNRDRIPDKWEKRHNLSLKVVQTRRDPDHDGLNNLGEFRAATDPRDRDSDNDGIRDGKERAGTVRSFDGTTLVISLFGGGTVEGKVTATTEVSCRAEDSAATASRDSGSGDGGRGSGRDGQGDDRGNDNPPDDRGNDNNDQIDDRGNDGDNPGENRGGSGTDDRGADRAARSCPAGALKAGAVVKEAELRATRDGLVYEEIELAA
jgi:hypothetical protein